MSDVMQVNIGLNQPQMEIKLCDPNEVWFVAGRGVGKTTGPEADFMASRAEGMPGHTGGVFANSFADGESKVIPKLMQGLADQGYFEGHHYVYDRKPPSDFDEPLTPVVSYKRHFSWYTGSTFPLVSLFERGGANAYDFQSGIFDEVKYMSKKQLEDEVFPTFRGSLRHRKAFGNSYMYLSKIFATDKEMDPLLIQWILDKRKLMDRERVDQVIALQIHLNDLEIQYIEASENKQAQLQKEIEEVKCYLNQWRKRLLFFCEASAEQNIDVLGQAWMDDKKRNMSEAVFKVAILNEDPTMVTESFYPDLNEQHEYRALYQEDINPTLPLIVSADYQSSVSPFPVAQIGKLPWEEVETLNFVDEISTVAPEGLEQAVDRFCEKFSDHQCKMVYYTTDHNAIGTRQSAKPFNEIVKDRFLLRGWEVVEVYTGEAPDHYEKYTRFKHYLSNTQSSPLQVRINKRCTCMLTALKNARTKNVNGQTKKEKKYERTDKYPDLDQRLTTHFTDAFDTLLWAVLEMEQIRYTTVGNGVGFR